MKLIIFTIALFVLCVECKSDKNFSLEKLLQNRRSFVNFSDDDKLESYLSSFGATPSPAEARRHEVFKRSSTARKVKKIKKIVSTTTTEAPVEIQVTPKASVKRKIRKVAVSTTEIPIITAAPINIFVEKKSKKAAVTEELVNEEIPKKPENFRDSPRQVTKFELTDAKYSAEYEKLKQSRKLKHRVKRAAEDKTNSNSTTKTDATKVEQFVTKENFVQPRELFKFSYLDAVTKAPEMNEGEKKIKRDVADSTAVESKTVEKKQQIHMSNPMRNQRSTKHVSYGDISQKLQKIIDAALQDAREKGKAVDGDYLKFFYGDTIIKVPVSMSKYVLNKPKEHASSYNTIAHSAINIGEEEPKTDSPKLLATKNAYYPLKNTKIKFNKPPHFLPTPSTDAYANFETPIVVQSEENKFSAESNYYSTDDVHYGKNAANSVSSPGPVLFHSTTPSSAEPVHGYNNYIYHPPTKLSIVKEQIPIHEHVDEGFSYIPNSPNLNEHVDEGFSYIPLVSKPNHIPFPVPTSYVEYTGPQAESHSKKSYEFGYHVSDYKTGNNFGHTQKSNKEETKGEYSILLPDGRIQTVKYLADDSGFHADVSYQNVH